MDNFLASNKQASNLIYFYRIILTILVFHLHYYGGYGYKTGGWYLSVDFFFLVSGYLLCRSFKEYGSDAVNPKDFIVSKLKRLYPEYFFSLSILCIALLFSNSTSISLKDYFSNALLFNIVSLEDTINTPSWYVVVLFWCEMLLFFLFRHINRICKVTSRRIFGFSIFIFLMYESIILINGNLDVWTSNILIIPYGFVRGMLGICFGITIFLISQSEWCTVFMNSSVSKVISIVSFLTFIIISWYLPWSEFDIVFIMIIAVSVLFGFSLVGLPRNIDNAIKYLNKLTYSAYLNQALIMCIFSKLLKNSMFRWYWFIIFVLVSFLYSAITDFVMTRICIASRKMKEYR